MSDRVLLLTGATGFIGGRLLRRLLLSDRDLRVVALVRAADQTAACRRGGDVIRGLFSQEEAVAADVARRIEWLHGDLTVDRLGLSRESRERVVSRVTEVFHFASTTDFVLPYELSLSTNYQGVRRLYELAREISRRGRLRRFHHVSTAYVAGRQRGVIEPGWLPDPRKRGLFGNSYEATKALSEDYLRRRMDESPITIYRPSIVVGSSQNGYTTNFNVLYSPIKLIRGGLLPFVPSLRETTLDIVPVDYVTDAMFHIARREDSAGLCYHITANEDAIPLESFLARLHSIYNLEREVLGKDLLPPTRTLGRWQWLLYRLLSLSVRGRRAREYLNLFERYRPYLLTWKRFDDTLTQKALEGSGCRRPEVRSYFDRIVAYAVKTNFGRHESKSIPRVFTHTGTSFA